MPTHSVQRTLKRYRVAIDGILQSVTPPNLRRSRARNLFITGIPPEVIRQNLGHPDVKTKQDHIGVLHGSTRASVSIYDASSILRKMKSLSQEK